MEMTDAFECMHASSSTSASSDQDEIGSLRFDGGAGGTKKDAGSDDDVLTDGHAPYGAVGLFYLYRRSILIVS